MKQRQLELLIIIKKNVLVKDEDGIRMIYNWD